MNMIKDDITAITDVLNLYRAGAKGRSTYCAIAQGKQRMKKIHKVLYYAKKIAFILAAVWLFFKVVF